MKNKLEKIKLYYGAHPKRFWVLGVIIVVILIAVFTHKSATTVTEITVEQKDLQQTILATGQVTSNTDLNLSFSASGLVASLPISVGDKVYPGQVLATLENKSEYATLKSAQANYQKVLEGSSDEEVAIAQAALDSAKSDLASAQKVQETLVENAHRAFLNVDLTPILISGTASVTPTVSGVYSGNTEGSYMITPYPSGNGGNFTLDGIEKGSGTINSNSSVELGTKGLYIQFPSNYSSLSGNVWQVLIPNTKSANYLTQYNAYQNAQKTHDSVIAAAQDRVSEAEANLNLKKAKARSVDLDIANAQVLSAQAAYDKTIIRAPASGTIVHVDTKIGERADAQKEVVVLQDVGNLYVEANINETNIAKVVLGQPVLMNLDAFGPTTSFTGSVIHIDPSSTTSGGVVNYIIKASISDPSGKNQIRPGMNANMTITAWIHPHVLVIPKVAVTTKDDGTSTVEVITDDKNGKHEKRVVTLGSIGDGNLVEISSGLSVGEKVALITTP